MSNEQIIRAWKDVDYRENAESNVFPPDPAGAIVLHDDELNRLQGGNGKTWWDCIKEVTDALSCMPTCDQTMWDGTCNVASIGCCKAAE